MRLLLTFSMLFTLMIGSAFAQPESVAPECEGLATWYEALPGDEVSAAYAIVSDSDMSRRNRQDALDAINGFANDLVDQVDGTDLWCIAQARIFLMDGWYALSFAGSSLMGSDMEEWQSYYAIAIQRIGELRGYMVAYGYDVTTEDRAVFFK